jgi:hypothetical protein
VDVPVGAPDLDANFAAVRRQVDGIADQVLQDLEHALGIGLHRCVAGRIAPPNDDLPRLGDGAEQIDRVVDQIWRGQTGSVSTQKRPASMRDAVRRSVIRQVHLLASSDYDDRQYLRMEAGS